MNSFLNKCDIELQMIYASFRSLNEGKKGRLARVHPVVQGGGRLSVLIRFVDNIQPVIDLGFEVTSMKEDNSAQGSLLLTDLESIGSHEQVISLSVGKAGRTMLNTSAVNIKVRGPGNVWQLNTTTKQFSGKTGNGVVVGIIDTGIDWSHPVFLASDSPKTTRIKRIWDPGIDPHDSAQSPTAQYMEGNDRYGVEYTDTMINAVLRGTANASPVKHRDCGGHGTHVASIAAGDGRAAKPGESNSEYKYIGVAPKADIVVVKVLDLFKFMPKTAPTPGNPGGTYILYDQMFKDAVTYILKVAELDLGNKPVVINYSIGDGIVAHDGFTEQEQWLTQKFGASNSKGLFCTSAGNDRGDQKHGIVTIPNTGSGTTAQIEIPFKLIDVRTVKTSFDKCRTADDTQSLYVGMWYQNPSGGQVLPHLTLKGKSEAAGLAVSAAIQHGYFGNNNQYHHTFIHSTKTFTKPATSGQPATSVTRNQILLKLSPTIQGDFLEGMYKIRLVGPKNTRFHIWMSFPGMYRIRFENTSMAGLQVPNTHLIGQPGGANNILTVASYSESNGSISSFSSPGPLADYTAAQTPYINKPDIAAPGSDESISSSTTFGVFPNDNGIIAAQSTHSTPPSGSPCCQKTAPPSYTGKSGTSMASPHIAGVAALILEKNGNLTTSQLIGIIKGNVQTGSGGNANDFGAGRIDAKKAVNNTPTP